MPRRNLAFLTVVAVLMALVPLGGWPRVSSASDVNGAGALAATPVAEPTDAASELDGLDIPPEDGSEPTSGSDDASNADDGAVSAAVAAAGISLSQPSPFPGESLDVTYTFQLDEDEDTGTVGFSGVYPSTLTTLVGQPTLQCSEICSTYSFQTSADEVRVTFFAGSGSVGQTIDLTIRITVNVEVSPGTTLAFQSTGNDGSSLSGSAVVSAQLIAYPGTIVAVNGRVSSGTVDAIGGVGNLTYVLAVNGGLGNAVIDPATGAFTYTPFANQTGSDSFLFMVSDSRNPGQQSDYGEVSIVILNPVTADDISLAVPFEGSSTGAVMAAGGRAPLSYELDSAPAKGTVDLRANGTFTYTADPDATGSDVFAILVSDDGLPTLTDTAIVTVSIGASSGLDALPLEISLDVGADGSVRGSLADQVTGGIAPYIFQVVTSPSQGSVVIDPDGTFTYTLNPGASGTDAFSYSVTDSEQPTSQLTGAATITGTVTIVFAPGPTSTSTIAPAVTPTVQPGSTQIATNPPGGGSGQPVGPDGADDGDSGDGGSDDGESSGGGTSSGGGSGAVPVTSLPSTGTGDETQTSALIVLLGGVLLIAIAGGLALRSRRP